MTASESGSGSRDILTELLAMVPTTPPPAPPPSAPSPGQSRGGWLAEVRSRRALFDELVPSGPAWIDGSHTRISSASTDIIPVEGGDLTVRVYTPIGDGPFPAVVFFHGGGWWMAGGETNFDLNDGQCRTFCDRLAAVVVNVDYRLAPEAPYPVQLEDCYRSVEWVRDHADSLSVDPSNVSVMGTSSGGNEAAAVCLLARERGGPPIRCQVLLAPPLDITCSSPSLQELPGLVEQLQGLAALYAPQDRWTDPLVSPLLADDLTRLPPAVIVTADFDPLRDDGRRYAERLEQAGVPVAWNQYPMMHGVALPETLALVVSDTSAAMQVWINPGEAP